MRAARPRHLLFLTVLMIALLCLVTGCGKSPDAPGPVVMDEKQHEAWEISLVEMRIDKNEEFADPERSPLAADKLPAFEGLNYYFPKPELRFRTKLEAEAKSDTVTLTKRKGDEVRYVHKGTVAFRHLEKVHQLAVFGPVDAAGADYLWLPFFDGTTGRETYGGGRYLDLKLDAEGMVEIDFNYAYNPLCDYNPDGFNCTLPPRGNTLSFAVEAGEKLFGGAH